MLRHMDGYQLCNQLRAASNFTPVLMLTARQRPEDRVQGLEAGADDYLTKPFDLDELILQELVNAFLSQIFSGRNT